MTQQDKLPADNLLDEFNYPTEEFLGWIVDYSPDESVPLEYFVELIRFNWCWGESMTKLTRPRKGKQKLVLHTGGWSGNEELIEALLRNFNIKPYLRYKMWKAGGHYYFELETPKK